MRFEFVEDSGKNLDIGLLQFTKNICCLPEAANNPDFTKKERKKGNEKIRPKITSERKLSSSFCTK